MPRRLRYGLAIAALAILVAFLVWQVSFHIPELDPATPSQSLILWAVTILAFVLMVALGWVLARTGVKLYVDSQAKREGSRLRTKLVLGALALSIVPVFFLVLFSYLTLSLNMNAWFTKPEERELVIFEDLAIQLKHEMHDETAAQAALLAMRPEIHALLENSVQTPGFLERFAREQELASVRVYRTSSDEPVDSWVALESVSIDPAITVRSEVRNGGQLAGAVELTARLPVDVAKTRATLERFSSQRAELLAHKRTFRFNYMMLMALITLFVMIVATWIALFLARLISVPIAALLEGASEIRGGNLHHRVNVRAGDEMGSLVRSFNRMTQELETSRDELDQRRRFTEAILESIPTGVISIASDGTVRRVNRALSKIFTPAQAAAANRLEDLFSREDTAEIKYLMKRARRTGAASRQLELRTENRTLQVAVTVSALEEKLTSGFVVVLEDTTELLRGQKAAAWHEVARRVAHEIKNPLTPIALSAERISRQLDRLELPPAAARIVGECAATITKSVDSVKVLVDEFSQFARFPSVQPVRADLNEVVREALGVFQGRLDGIHIDTHLAEGLPAVNLDREQFQRVVVNLVDNAAEAMQDSLIKELYIATQTGAAETVELVVADSGCGIGPEDKEKLFLPYFSTKKRGTGLGLAIVSHVVAEHGAQIRVEDNQPLGARFTVEIPAVLEPDPAEMGAQPAAGKL
jgi:two-component system, NtrC family, nitrogen regulation sensor histidine kinase NtrY